MLVLSRKVGQSIVVGDETTIRVISVGRDKVRLGIEAPGWVKILRVELLADEPHRVHDHPESPSPLPQEP